MHRCIFILSYEAMLSTFWPFVGEDPRVLPGYTFIVLRWITDGKTHVSIRRFRYCRERCPHRSVYFKVEEGLGSFR